MSTKSLNRREFLKLAGMTVAAGSMGGLLAGCVPPAAPAAPQIVKETVVVPAVPAAAKPVYMANVIRTLSNEYHSMWNRGGRVYAESQGQGKNYRGCFARVTARSSLP